MTRLVEATLLFQRWRWDAMVYNHPGHHLSQMLHPSASTPSMLESRSQLIMLTMQALHWVMITQTTRARECSAAMFTNPSRHTHAT
jgi:hypothetical protein